MSVKRKVLFVILLALAFAAGWRVTAVIVLKERSGMP